MSYIPNEVKVRQEQEVLQIMMRQQPRCTQNKEVQCMFDLALEEGEHFKH